MEVPAGIISDRIGRRRLFLVGVGLSVLGSFLCAQARTIHFLILGRGIWGFGAAIFFMNSTALIIDLFESKVRGRALGLFNGIESMGNVVGAPIGAFLVNILGYYSNVFYVTVILTTVCFILAITSKSFKETKTKRKADSGLSAGEILRSLRSYGIVTICTYSFTNTLIWSGLFSTILQLYFSIDLSFPLEYTSLVLSARTIGNIVAAVGASSLAERFGRREVVAAGFITSAVSLAVFAASSRLDIFIIMALLESFGQSLAGNTLMVLLADIAPPSVRGGAIGLQRTFMDVGGFMGPLALILVYSSLGSRFAFLAGVGIQAVNISLLVLMRKKLVVGEAE